MKIGFIFANRIDPDEMLQHVISNNVAFWHE